MTWSIDGAHAIVFDALGTLLLPLPGALRPLRWLRPHEGTAQSLERSFLTRSEPLRELVTEYRGSASLQLIEWEAMRNASRIRVHAKATPLLAQLRHARVRVALCGDVAEPYAQAVRALLPGMDAYTLSCDVGSTTADLRFWEIVSCGLCCAPDQVLFVTHDNTLAASAARAAGLRAIVAAEQDVDWAAVTQRAELPPKAVA